MKTNTKVLMPLILFSIGIGWLIGAALDVNKVIEFKRADDGTPCYTFGSEFECNFDRANVRTNYGLSLYKFDQSDDSEWGE